MRKATYERLYRFARFAATIPRIIMLSSSDCQHPTNRHCKRRLSRRKNPIEIFEVLNQYGHYILLNEKAAQFLSIILSSPPPRGRLPRLFRRESWRQLDERSGIPNLS